MGNDSHSAKNAPPQWLDALAGFSVLTAVQADFLIIAIRKYQRRIASAISVQVEPDGTRGMRIDIAEGDHWGPGWLLILGCYEVLRTMRASQQFSADMLSSIAALEVQFKALRIPMTKQEQPGAWGVRDPAGSLPASYRADPADIGFDLKDGRRVYICELLQEFVCLIEGITYEHLALSNP